MKRLLIQYQRQQLQDDAKVVVPYENSPPVRLPGERQAGISVVSPQL